MNKQNVGNFLLPLVATRQVRQGGYLHKNIFDVKHLHQSKGRKTDEDVVHRKYFCVNNHLVSLVELLLEAEENFLRSVYCKSFLEFIVSFNFLIN